MTDNPIEVQEEIEEARRAVVVGAQVGDVLAPLEAYRTAILKHDPVVTGLGAALMQARKSLAHGVSSTRDFCNWGPGCPVCAIEDALEAYRTAVAGDHDED